MKHLLVLLTVLTLHSAVYAHTGLAAKPRWAGTVGTISQDALPTPTFAPRPTLW